MPLLLIKIILKYELDCLQIIFKQACYFMTLL
jgi:hypothetical protein